MVAWHATFLCAQKWLVKGKQHLIQFINIVVSVYQEILHDHIKFTAMRKGKTRPADKILCFIDIQFQSKSESQRRCLGSSKTAFCPHLPSCRSQNLSFRCGQ